MAEDRTDARRPAKRKGQPHDVCAPQPDRLCELNPFLSVEERNRREAEEVQSHDDDRNAGNGRERPGPGADQRADHARTCTKCNEYRAETEHEQDGCEHSVAPCSRRALTFGETFKRGAGHIDQIGGHQRQHAGREKTHQPGDQRGKNTDINGHAP